jgi:hypothetical protein
MNTSSILESYEEIKSRQKDIPEDYRMLPFLIGTEVDIPPEERFRQDQEISKDAPLWAVHTEVKKFRTSQPIKVHIFRDGDFFFAENETLMVCGTGESIWEAVEDLGLHIIHLWEYYNKLSWDRVMGDAKRLKGLYQNLLIEEQ